MKGLTTATTSLGFVVLAMSWRTLKIQIVPYPVGAASMRNTNIMG